MRNYILFATVAILGSALTYMSLQNTNRSEPTKVAVLQTEFKNVDNLQGKINLLASSLHDLQILQQQQLQQTQSEQAQLKKMILDLSAKLDVANTTVAIAVTNQTPIADEPKILKSGEIIENKLGHWMDNTLNNNDSWNADATAKIREQTSQSLEKLANVNLDDLQCSERFCRAIFSDSQNNGNLPDVTEIMGIPPFTNDVFSVVEQDGRVSLYFTGAGVSLGDLQNEVTQNDQLN